MVSRSFLFELKQNSHVSLVTNKANQHNDLVKNNKILEYLFELPRF